MRSPRGSCVNSGALLWEKLNIRGMTRSASGTVDDPGTNVAAKSGLNREILAQGWGHVREQLRYKAAWAGREFVEVDPKYTSRLCSRCGLGGERSGKEFSCRNCGFLWDADLNAAVNVLWRAFGSGGPPVGGYAGAGAVQPFLIPG